MHFIEVRSCCGVPSVVSRSSLGGIEQPIREVKEIGFLINSTFCNWEFLGSSLVRPWFVLGYWRGNTKEDTRESNLNKSTIYEKISIKERGASNETPLKY